MSWEAIEAAIEACDAERVADLCLGMDEPERATYAERSVALYAALDGRWRDPNAPAIETARFGLGPPLPLRGPAVFRPPPDCIEALVRARPRAWRDHWAQWAVRHRGVVTWTTLRALLRAGECDRPDAQPYGRALAHACIHHPDPQGMLRDDPEVLAEDVWLPFADDHYHGWEAWEQTLIALAADGTISRDRLVDEALTALDRVTDPAAGKRWVAFHDRVLMPTLAEQAARVDVYLRWLEGDRDVMIGFALGHLLRLDRKLPIDPDRLLDRLGVAVAVPAKTHARRAVTLVGRALDRAPALAAADLLADALAHPAAEVQLEANKILERHPGALDAERLAELAAGLDPALRPRETTALLAVAVPEARPDVVWPWPEPITPVADLEELLDLAARLVEGVDDPDENERLVDGLARLCDRDVPIGRRKALLKRARQRKPADHRLAAQLIHHWLDPDGAPHAPFGGDAFSRRMRSLATRLQARQADILLAAPTHRGGWIEADVLAQRLERASAVADEDLAQALLRLRDGAQITLPGDQRTLPASHDSISLRVDPSGDGCSPGRVYVMEDPKRDWMMFYEFRLFRWLGLVWPARRDLLYTRERRSLFGGYDSGASQRRLRAALETMRYPDHWLGPDALSVLAEALERNDDLRLLATDVLYDAIAARRLAPRELGGALANADCRPETAVSRLGASLQPIADGSALHQHELQRALEAMIGALGAPSAQHFGVIDLLRRLAVEADAAITLPEARARLEALGTSSKSGKLARAALEVTGDGAQRSVTAAAQAAYRSER